MPVAPTLGEFNYTLKGDDTGTVFRLRTLSWMEREDAVGDGNSSLATIRKALNYGLIGWENFRREDGSEVVFRRVDEGKRQVLPKEMLDLVQPWAIELANAIFERTRFTEDHAKNSL